MRQHVLEIQSSLTRSPEEETYFLSNVLTLKIYLLRNPYELSSQVLIKSIGETKQKLYTVAVV